MESQQPSRQQETDHYRKHHFATTESQPQSGWTNYNHTPKFVTGSTRFSRGNPQQASSPQSNRTNTLESIDIPPATSQLMTMIELQRRPQAALSGIDLRKRHKNMPQTPPYEEKIPLPEIKKKHRRKGSKASVKSAQDEDQHPRVKDVVSAYENTKDRRQIKRFLEKRKTLQQSNIKRSSSLQQSIIVSNQKEAEKLISIDPYRSQQEIVRQQSPRLFKPRVNLGKQISPLRLNNKSPRPVPSPITKEEMLPPLIQYRSGLGTVVSNFINQPTIQSQFNTIQATTAHGNFVNTGVRSLSSSLFKQKQQALKSNREDKPTVVVQQTKQLNPITY